MTKKAIYIPKNSKFQKKTLINFDLYLHFPYNMQVSERLDENNRIGPSLPLIKTFKFEVLWGSGKDEIFVIMLI